MRPEVVAEHRAMQQFVDAVLDLAEDPDPINVEGYLAASRALEEARPKRARARRTRRASDLARSSERRAA